MRKIRAPIPRWTSLPFIQKTSCIVNPAPISMPSSCMDDESRQKIEEFQTEWKTLNGRASLRLQRSDTEFDKMIVQTGKVPLPDRLQALQEALHRSEERRVGKECRSR